MAIAIRLHRIQNPIIENPPAVMAICKMVRKAGGRAMRSMTARSAPMTATMHGRSRHAGFLEAGPMVVILALYTSRRVEALQMPSS
jgi:hypothetical protein